MRRGLPPGPPCHSAILAMLNSPIPWSTPHVTLFCLGPLSQALMLPGHGRLCLQPRDKELTGSTRINWVPAGVGRCLRCQGQCSVAGTGLSPQHSPPPLSCFSAGARPPTPPPNTGWKWWLVTSFPFPVAWPQAGYQDPGQWIRGEGFRKWWGVGGWGVRIWETFLSLVKTLW